MAEPTNEEKILENALAPKKASGDSGSMEMHDIDSQIKADKYAESKRASRVRGLGVKITKLVPPGGGD